MTIYRQISMKPRDYVVGGTRRRFSADDLREYAEGTNAAIAAGIKIPLLSRHAPAGADDGAYAQFEEIANQFSSDGANALDNYGWLKSVEINDDGSITPVMEVLNSEAAKAIDDGIIQFTSPEFRDGYTDGIGREHGRVMRHIAFTPTPRNPDQGPIEKDESGELAFQFSIDEGEIDVDSLADDRTQVYRDGSWQFMEDDEGESSSPSQLDNPDMPPKPVDPKNQAIVAQLAELGAELPSDFDLNNENACDLLLTALKTLNAAQRRSDEEETPETPDVEEQSMQFSEDDIRGMKSESERKMARIINKQAERIEDQDSKIAQFSEDSATSKRDQRKTTAEELIERAKITPAGKKALRDEFLGSVQFSEESDLDSVRRAVKVAEASCPPSLQFGEIEEHDVGDVEPSDEDHQQAADDQLASVGFRVPAKA